MRSSRETPSRPVGIPAPGDRSGRAHALDATVSLFIVVNLALMLDFPREATIPFHSIWIAALMLCGLRAWGHRQTDVVLVTLCLVTTGVLGWLAVRGAIEAEEVAEAPLMTLAFLVSSWHLRRRQSAADAERDHRFAEELAARRLGHDLRNPLTVARGYVELIALRSTDSTITADAHLALHELDRLATLARRLSSPLVEPDGR
jgi:signal transduction histidine kinase